MSNAPSWQYDELQQVGTDYNDQIEVDAYDSRHAQFREIEEDNRRLLDLLEIKADQTVIEIGTGTGNFAIQAAARCARVFAVDVSIPMLNYAKKKAGDADATNIEFHHAGFLTYNHGAEPVDVIVSSLALHHLPDFWKGVALGRLNKMLKPGGKLYVSDVIYEEKNVLHNIDLWVKEITELGGEVLREDFEKHIRDEYSTLDWIMDGLLTRSGFRIEDRAYQQGVMGNYLCTKVAQTSG